MPVEDVVWLKAFTGMFDDEEADDEDDAALDEEDDEDEADDEDDAALDRSFLILSSFSSRVFSFPHLMSDTNFLKSMHPFWPPSFESAFQWGPRQW